jgi:hypothetical protein
MFRSKRPAFDEARAHYGKDITRCYGAPALELALCGMEHFLGFNLAAQPGEQPTEVVRDRYVAHGVVHEPFANYRHLACRLHFSDERGDDGFIGHFYLTRKRAQEFEPDVIRVEDAELEVIGSIKDANATYRSALIDCMRDAALSGFQFIHMEVGCAPPADSYETIMSQMGERGYASSRRITGLKMWPKIELVKAPPWARKKD